MTIPEQAAQYAVEIANDNSHGYDQTHRWGEDYDCSSLVITCYKMAGVPLTSTYTGNMKQDFLAHGFVDVKNDVNITTGAGLQTGDVLLNEIHHAAMYVGNGQMVEATGNENGGTTGGKPGDQTGKEIAINPYHNYGWGVIGWDAVLRYEGNEKPAVDTPDTYTVKAGDSLWAIAQKYGMDVNELANLNHLGLHEYIYPGQVLKLKPTTAPTTEPTTDTYTVKQGDSLWQIAQAKLGSGWKWPDIANANDIKFPYTIYPGEKLKIPK